MRVNVDTVVENEARPKRVLLDFDLSRFVGKEKSAEPLPPDGAEGRKGSKRSPHSSREKSGRDDVAGGLSPYRREKT